MLGRQPHRSRSRLLAIAAALVLGASLAAAVPASAETGHHAKNAGKGADLPFSSYEAEDAATNGTAIGPDYTQGTVASEASGRRAVELDGSGDYVEFTLTAAANAVDVAYNLHDGQSGTLSVYVNGTKLDGRLAVTSKYSYMDTPWIAGSKTHHLFDDSRMRLGGDLSSGDTVRLQVDDGDSAGPYAIDVADFEQVGPAADRPADSVSVVDSGADPNGQQDSTDAFDQAIQQAKSSGAEVWIPGGDFLLNRAISVEGVTIRGAGDWYSVVHSSRFIDQGQANGKVELRDFAVFGEVTERVDSNPDNFVNGSLGTDSVVSGMWLQHLKVGLWLTGTNSNLHIDHNRILDMAADGINLNGTATGAVVSDNFVRNTGDDGLAMWSLNSPDVGDSFVDNTVVQPNLANGIAIYGGTDNTVEGNLVADTNALGSGIAVSNQKFADPFHPLAGTTTVSDNTLVRTGAMNPNWNHPMGALRVDSYDSSITDATVTITNTTATDSPYSVFEFVSGGGNGYEISRPTVDGATINGAGTVVVQAETKGAATLSNVTASDVGSAGIYNCPYPSGSGQFTVDAGSGNSGWDTVWDDCDSWPQPTK
ncbi:MAG TPA: glycosyl hydrolase family 28-related protein [Stackebrandtia sp.]|jgi:hypothetical protein|nr:glycosyl hydrolase family 28-related protein [Stackebrandtia sp.]HZE41499.1 glycosyl hydrolase family 28-related protein [Stackebrandtia sp.]